MSELKATPAPWRAGIDGNLRIYAPDGMGELSGLVAKAFRREDVHLIAKAPELYRTLEQTARELNAVIKKMNAMLEAQITATDLNPPDYWDQQTVQEAMEVLAMARGEMP